MDLNNTILDTKIEQDFFETVDVQQLTEAYQQLQFENEKLQSYVSHLETDVDEAVGDYKMKCDRLEAENIELKELLNNCKNASTTIDNLRSELYIRDIQLQEEISEKNRLASKVTDLNNECASKNEIIKIIRQQLEELQKKEMTIINNDEFKFPMKTAKSKPFQKMTPISITNNYSVLQCRDSTEKVNETTNNHIINSKSKEKCMNNKLKCKPNITLNKNTQLIKNREKVLILADSHGRDLCQHVTNQWMSTNKYISSIIKPNATLCNVVDNLNNLVQNFNKNDIVIVIGGTNDKIIGNEDTLLNKFKDIIDNTQHTNLVLAGLPLRHLEPEASDSVDNINFDLQVISQGKNHVWYLPLDKLPRHMYTRHGFHFNRKGKRKIASLLRETIQDIDEEIAVNEERKLMSQDPVENTVCYGTTSASIQDSIQDSLQTISVNDLDSSIEEIAAGPMKLNVAKNTLMAEVLIHQHDDSTSMVLPQRQKAEMTPLSTSRLSHEHQLSAVNGSNTSPVLPSFHGFQTPDRKKLVALLETVNCADNSNKYFLRQRKNKKHQS